MGFLSFHSVDTPILKECKSDEDKISGCVEREYDSNGNLRRETPFKNGDKEGMQKTYYKNGNLALETPYKNDKREIMLKLHDENGKLREISYKSSKIEGVEKEYYENGNLKAEIPFKNDSVNGDIKLYTKDGKLLALIKVENQFINGKCFNNKVLTDKELKGIRTYDNIEEKIIYLQKICLKSDSK